MITFEEARAIVAANRGPAYPPEFEFQVAPWGYETDEEWVILAGSYPEIYGPRSPADFAFVATGNGPMITVNKTTGEYRETYGEPPHGQVLTEVGEHPRFTPPPGL